MYVNINGKVIEVTNEEYEALVGDPACDCHYKPTSKMEELIDAVKSIKDAIPTTTYTLEKNGSTISLVGSDGSVTSVEDQDLNTSYNIDIDGRTITMRGSDNSIQNVELPEDKNTEYNLTFDPENDKLTLNSSDEEETPSVVELDKFADDKDIEHIMNSAVTTEDLDTLFNH